MQDIVKAISKYIFSAILFIAAIVSLIFYVNARGSETQPPQVMMGVLLLFICASVSLPAILSRIGRIGSLVLVVVFLGASIFLAYQNVHSIESELEYQAMKDKMETTVIQRMKDIRTAQEAYRKVNGAYAKNFEELKAFIVKPLVPITSAENPIINNDSIMGLPEEERLSYVIGNQDLLDLEMTREEAIEKGYEIRDTSYVSLFDENFDPAVRAKNNLPPVNLDSLFYSPYKGDKFILKTGEIEVSGGIKVSTILVKDPNPIFKEKEKPDTLMFGSLDEDVTNGNWGSR